MHIIEHDWNAQYTIVKRISNMLCYSPTPSICVLYAMRVMGVRIHFNATACKPNMNMECDHILYANFHRWCWPEKYVIDVSPKKEVPHLSLWVFFSCSHVLFAKTEPLEIHAHSDYWK